MKINWSSHFVRETRAITKNNLPLLNKLNSTLEILEENPFTNSLNTHKLKGYLLGSWSCSIDYQHRIVFDFVNNPETDEQEILLQSIGTHDEVY
ncbi:MAG: type toxin-antitoxin system mRNA interferase toxin [Ignavibacteria bacterium]|nr:type toxin-antitoxin system mRNA interferase toxin [Ignavibacteria bacterium]